MKSTSAWKPIFYLNYYFFLLFFFPSTLSSEIVIDEWVGQWLALWMLPHSFLWGLVAFGFFRIFDIFKPGPIQMMDDIKSGVGIMMDDVVAGILALFVTQSLVYFMG